MLTATAAAKKIIARTKYSPAASWALLLLDSDLNVIEVLVARLVKTASLLVWGLLDYLLLA